MFRRVGIVFNGSKSSRRVEAFVAAARVRLGVDASAVALYPCHTGADVSVQARRAVDDGRDLVVAAGGDGTILGVLRGMADSHAVLGVLPLGTANDLAGALGVTSDQRALSALVDGCVRRVDLVDCQYRGEDGAPRQDVIVSSAGLGFTAELTLLERTPEMQRLKRLGNLFFTLVAAKLLLTYSGASMRIRLDDKREVRRSGSLVELGKVARIGGLPLVPRARLDSGTLDLCVFDGSTRRAAQLLLTLQFSQRHLGWPDYHYFTGMRSLELIPDDQVPLHLHGEYMGTGPVRLDVRPGALRVLSLAPPG